MKTAVTTLLAVLALVWSAPLHAQPKGAPEAPRPQEPKKEDAPKPAYAIEVVVLHGTNTKKGIDGRIEKMPELTKPPFSSYDSYELLKKETLAARKDEPKTLQLPNGRVLQTRLLEVVAKEQVKISASIDHPGGKKFLPLLEVNAKLGQRFIVAGQSYKGGILVLVIRVVAA